MDKLIKRLRNTGDLLDGLAADRIIELEAQNKQLADALLLELKIAETPPVNSAQAKRIESALGEGE